MKISVYSIILIILVVISASKADSASVQTIKNKVKQLNDINYSRSCFEAIAKTQNELLLLSQKVSSSDISSIEKNQSIFFQILKEIADQHQQIPKSITIEKYNEYLDYFKERFDLLYVHSGSILSDYYSFEDNLRQLSETARVVVAQRDGGRNDTFRPFKEGKEYKDCKSKKSFAAIAKLNETSQQILTNIVSFHNSIHALSGRKLSMAKNLYGAVIYTLNEAKSVFLQIKVDEGQNRIHLALLTQEVEQMRIHARKDGYIRLKIKNQRNLSLADILRKKTRVAEIEREMVGFNKDFVEYQVLRGKIEVYKSYLKEHHQKILADSYETYVANQDSNIEFLIRLAEGNLSSSCFELINQYRSIMAQTITPSSYSVLESIYTKILNSCGVVK